MRTCFLLILFTAFYLPVTSGNDPLPAGKGASGRLITKKRLVHLIDSVFELKTISKRDLDLLHYYSSILETNHADTVRVYDLNLRELNFYPEKDEKVIFPAMDLSSLPARTELILENGHLSFFTNPVSGVVTSNYGWREGKLHKGTDIDLNRGDKVRSAFAGKVRFARYQGGYGNVVVVMHPNGLETVYAHLSRIRVRAGDVVQSGQVIGLGGNTGHSSGSHLHFEVRYKGQAINPGAIIAFDQQKLVHHTITIRAGKTGLTAYPANCNMHVVRKGDSWNGIARKYGLSLKELMAMNGIGRRQYLKPGQVIRVE